MEISIYEDIILFVPRRTVNLLLCGAHAQVAHARRTRDAGARVRYSSLDHKLKMTQKSHKPTILTMTLVSLQNANVDEIVFVFSLDDC